jgi:hypothetical protein
MEYIIVKFGGEDRGVVIDGISQGRTEMVLEVERGSHEISLEEPPSDFKPLDEKVVVRDTTPLSPQEVSFEKIYASIAGGNPPGAAPAWGLRPLSGKPAASLSGEPEGLCIRNLQ